MQTVIQIIREWEDDIEPVEDLIKRLSEAGYVIVPKEPTDEMVTAAHEVGAYWHHDVSEIVSEWREEMRQEYRAMVGAYQ